MVKVKDVISLQQTGKQLVFILIILICGSLYHLGSANETGSQPVYVLQIDGAIGPAVSDYFQKGIKTALANNAAVVVLQINTPGGLDSSMRDMIRAILNSPIPVISYVFPDGSRAASAGTYILYASHIAAMAPATNLGAATPVQIGGMPQSPQPEEQNDKKDKDKSEPPLTSMQKKIIHDAAAYIRSLAERHGRNAEWAEQAVREAVSLTAAEAKKNKVIDIVAKDLDDLLNQAEGRVVSMASGKLTVSCGSATPVYITPSWQNNLLAVISDPNIAYLLLLLGMYGLIYELANPGVFFPGVAGGISLLLALYGFQVLPVNYSGIALIVLGIVLMVSEAFVPSFGSLGFGGIIAFAAGSLILFDEESLRVSRALITGTTGVSALVILMVMGQLLRMRKKKIRTGAEAIIGTTGEVIDDFTGEGRIWLFGESWQAESEVPLKKGDKVKIIAQNGLVLRIEKHLEA